MLRGETVTLRARRREDVEVLHAAFDQDPAMHAVVSETPWLPVTLEQRLAEFDKRLGEAPDARTAGFVVQRTDDPAGTCVGSASLWDIDVHNRIAHLGLSLVPQARGQGLGREAVDLMCAYAFDHRDLHTLLVETLATNTGMQALATSRGFVLEGRRREVALVVGQRVDELLYGLLAGEWRARRRA